MFTMKSKYNSRCRYCGNQIGIGDPIAKGESSWGHVNCVKNDCVKNDRIEPEMPATVRELVVIRQIATGQAVSEFQATSPTVDAFAPQAAPETTLVQPEREFIPSVYQQAIFDEGLHGSGNLVVNATAGSGKTRTNEEFIKRYIPADKTWIYLVFNKKNQMEANEKFGGLPGGSAQTFHSFCLNNSIKQAYGKVKIDGKKVYQILYQIDPDKNDKELWPLINKVVGLIKNTLTDPNDYDSLISMIDHYAVELNGSASRVIELARDVIELCKAQTHTVDFDDMLWLTAINNLPLPQYDYVLVDEAQDLNATQISIVLRICKPDGRTIAIGDTNQAIYGFRGADADAMDKVIAALSAKTLPLSLCYRNSKSVVRFVNAELPHIKHESLPDAPEGEVLTIKECDLQACVKPGDMVVCRTNAPLIRPCFGLIRQGIKAVIMGRSIGEELVNLIDRISSRAHTDDLNIVLAQLEQYKVTEINRLMNQGKESAAQALEDKVDTIHALADGCTRLNELTDKADSIFSDDAKGVVFSSAHRAKGLEADSVFILRYDLMPHPMALKSGKDWQLKQETNCKFVALTRAKQRLYFVEIEE